jgi:hypothetical protein
MGFRFIPAPSWEVNISYDIIRNSNCKFSVGYQRGSLPVRYRVAIPAFSHPQIEYELDFPFYYTQHPYNTISCSFSFALKGQWLVVGLGNRFYESSTARTGITVHADNGDIIDVMDCESHFNRNSLCPQATIGISGCIWKKFPSWNYEVNVALAPIEVVNGSIIFFPEDPNLISSGSFSVGQSNISVGLLYRRVKREN